MIATIKNGPFARQGKLIYIARNMAPSDSAALQPGILLDGRYRFKTMLGEGAMGKVFLAEDVQLSRRVAVKVLHDGTDDEHLERLFREARACARSDHPAIVTMYGYGTCPDHDASYVVMEYLQGETVAERIARLGSLPHELVLRIALETADALAAAHSANVIHRDIKPSNIFLAARGRRVDEIKLLDFGVAKQLDLDTLTATGQVYGTPAYMAPEQLLDSKRVAPSCDLYALGAVLWECLTGSRPIDAPNMIALVAAIQFGPELSARELGSDVSPALAAVITRCLRKRPEDRFADAQSMRAALAACV
jgi:serine/threonine protein kinase